MFARRKANFFKKNTSDVLFCKNIKKYYMDNMNTSKYKIWEKVAIRIKNSRLGPNLLKKQNYGNNLRYLEA